LLGEFDEESTSDVNNTPLDSDQGTNNEIRTTMNDEDNYICLKFQSQDERVDKLKVKKVSVLMCYYSLL